MNIIFMTKGYEPVASASGSLVKNVVTAAAREHAVTVITQGETGDALMAQGVGPTVVRVPVQPVRRWTGRARRTLGGVTSLRSVGPLTAALDAVVSTPDDIVIPTTPDEFVAALRLRRRRRFVMLPFFLEVLPRPPVVASGLGFLTIPGHRRRRRFEARLMRSSDATLALPAAHRVLAREHSRASNLILTEHPMIRRVAGADRPAGAREPAEAVYAGGLDRRVRNPRHMLDVLGRASATTALTTHFYSYGNCEDMLAEAAHGGTVRQHGAVAPSTAMEAMAGADLLLTQGNRDSLLTPSKIFDCMSTGRPVVHFYSSDDDPYLDYLRRYGLALTLDMRADPGANADALVAFIDSVSVDGAHRSYEEVVRTFPECTPEHLLSKVLALGGVPTTPSTYGP